MPVYLSPATTGGSTLNDEQNECDGNGDEKQG